MFAPLQKTPEPARPAYTPTLRPAQPFFPPRPTVAAKPPAQVAPQPGPGLLAAVPTALAPAVAALGHVAQQQATYQLLCYALGQDPLTGRAVAATPQALARPLLSLLPDGEARYQQLQAAGPTLAQLPAWFETQLAAHHLGRDRLHQLLAHTLAQARALKWDDILFKLTDVAQALAEPWLRLSLDIGRLLVDSELAMLRLVVRAVLGAEAEPLLALLNQAGGLLLRILRNPLPFVRTLLAAGRQGFTAFVAKAPAYLQDAAQHWLFGSLAAEGIPVPKTWTPRALLELLLAVLGLSKAHVLARLETQLRAQVGPAAAGRIQQLGGAALTLWQQGPAGLWQELTAHTGALLPQALGAVQGRLTQLLATGVARLLVKLALPGGALVQVLQSGYDVYETLVARARELAQVGRTLFALAGSLAQGAVAPAAQALEAVLARLLPVALDFLARTFGLDKLPKLLRLGLEALRRPIDKGIDWVLGKIVQLAKNAWKGVKQGGAAAAQAGQQAIGAVKGWLGFREEFTLPSTKEHHSVFLAEASGQLMLASTPTPYMDFFLKNEKKQIRDLTTSTAPKGTHKESVADLWKTIRELTVSVEALSQERTQLDTDQQTFLKQGKAVANGHPGTGAVDQKQLLAANKTKLTERLRQLATATLRLLERSYEKGAIHKFTVAYADKTTPAGFGGGVLVEYLTMGKDQHDGTQPKSNGTATNSAFGNSNPWYKKLSQRRSGQNSYYEQGHLLSNLLHGPGTDWRNLTPLSRSGNGKHEQVEKIIKKAALDPNVDHDQHPRLFFYSVVPQYGRPVRKDSLDELAPELTPATGGKATYANKLSEVIEAEQYVPRGLMCIVWEVNAEGKRQAQVYNDLVENRIEADNLFDYQMQDKPVQININRMSDNTALQPVVGKRLSERIFKIVVAASKNYSGWRELHQALKADNAKATGDVLSASELVGIGKRLSWLTRYELIAF